MGSEQLKQSCGVIHFCQVAGLQIGHEDDWQDNLVSRKSQKKSHENDAVQSHERAERIKKV